MKIRPMGAELFHAGGRTDRQTQTDRDGQADREADRQTDRQT